MQEDGYSLLQLAAMAKGVSAEPMIREITERDLAQLPYRYWYICRSPPVRTSVW